MMSHPKLILICTLFMYSTISSATGDLWDQAVERYQSGEYQLAAEKFEAWIANGNASYQAFFNLGNSHFQMSDIPRAVLAYERALRYRPNARDARNNLEMAKRQMTEQITPVRGFFLNRWLHAVSFSLSMTAWGVVFLLLLWSAVAVKIHHLLRPPGIPQAQRIFLILLIAAAGAGLLGVERYGHFHSDHTAIVMTSTSLKIAPDDQSADVRSAPAGTKIVVTDSLEGYYKVRLMNYEEGWLPKELIERI